MLMLTHKKQTGFTIVELLIVIVVIGILAAITIVAYNGMQTRARYSVMQQDISSINKAIQLYYADNGYYPYSGTTGANVTANSTTTLNIPGLSPQYIQAVPKIPNDGKAGYYAYIWQANGTEYKIVRLANTQANLPEIERDDPRSDPYRVGRGWGYWSNGGANI